MVLYMNMNRFVIAANWKMHFGVQEAKDWCNVFLSQYRPTRGRAVMVFPPYILLPIVMEALHGSGIWVGGQNMYHAPKGAFTGEVSGAMLWNLGCGAVIIGHSERRKHFHEDDALLAMKRKAAMDIGLQTIFCVGEEWDQREAGTHHEFVRAQLLAGLADIQSNDLDRLIIAYEPVWAIGTGKTATQQDIVDMHGFIRATLRTIHSDAGIDDVPILYGGSVNEENAAEILSVKDVNGVLVGGASLDPLKFLTIVNSIPMTVLGN